MLNVMLNVMLTAILAISSCMTVLARLQAQAIVDINGSRL
jgi:hypothetical protein